MGDLCTGVIIVMGVDLKSDKEKFEEKMIDREWKDGENQ